MSFLCSSKQKPRCPWNTSWSRPYILSCRWVSATWCPTIRFSASFSPAFCIVIFSRMRDNSGFTWIELNITKRNGNNTSSCLHLISTYWLNPHKPGRRHHQDLKSSVACSITPFFPFKYCRICCSKTNLISVVLINTSLICFHSFQHLISVFCISASSRRNSLIHTHRQYSSTALSVCS